MSMESAQAGRLPGENINKKIYTGSAMKSGRSCFSNMNTNIACQRQSLAHTSQSHQTFGSASQPTEGIQPHSHCSKTPVTPGWEQNQRCGGALYDQKTTVAKSKAVQLAQHVDLFLTCHAMQMKVEQWAWMKLSFAASLLALEISSSCFKAGWLLTSECLLLQG